MKKFAFLSILFVALLSLATTDAFAQTKVGYVDPSYILQRMPEMASVRQKLQNFQEKKVQELQNQEAGYRQALNDYSQKEALLSDDAKAAEQKNLAQMEADLQQAQVRIQQELNQKQQEWVGPLLSSIQTAIDAVAKKQALTYVLNTTTSSGDVIILYASEDAQAKYDITQAVLTELGI